MAARFLGRAPWAFAPEDYAEMRAWEPAWGHESEPAVYFEPLQAIEMDETSSMVLTDRDEFIRGAPLERVAPALAAERQDCVRFPGPAWCLLMLWNYERTARTCARPPRRAHALLPLWAQAPPWVVRFGCDVVDVLNPRPRPWSASPEEQREARGGLLASLGVLIAATRAAGHPSADFWSALQRLVARHWLLVASEGGDAGVAGGAARGAEPEPEE